MDSQCSRVRKETMTAPPIPPQLLSSSSHGLQPSWQLWPSAASAAFAASLQGPEEQVRLIHFSSPIYYLNVVLTEYTC